MFDIWTHAKISSSKTRKVEVWTKVALSITSETHLLMSFKKASTGSDLGSPSGFASFRRKSGKEKRFFCTEFKNPVSGLTRSLTEKKKKRSEALRNCVRALKKTMKAAFLQREEESS